MTTQRKAPQPASREHALEVRAEARRREALAARADAEADVSSQGARMAPLEGHTGRPSVEEGT